MLKFWGVHEGFYEGVAGRIDAFRSACAARGIEYVDVDSSRWDYSDIPRLRRNDLLFNISRGSQVLISLLLNDSVTTVYRSNPQLELITSTTSWSILHEKYGLCSPRTIFSLTADRNLLKRYVPFLGGFPLIVKAVGGTRGIGTMKIESWHALLSIADYLMASGQQFVMRQFIEASYGVRTIVVGDGIVAASKFRFQQNDFRNAAILADAVYSPHNANSQEKDLCTSATRLANIEVAGVDLLVDQFGTAYLLEVNLPLGFQSVPVNERSLVAGAIVDHLVGKAAR